MIRERGPLTVAAFMELALYDPLAGYYARAARRSGRAGDFFTSVDVGSLFGELLAVQIGEMIRILDARSPRPGIDLVEGGAGNGQLAADILGKLAAEDGEAYARTRLHLVETSAAARAAQRATLGIYGERLVSSGDSLPDAIDGIVIANELLDALPTHQVVMRENGLREVFVEAEGDTLRTIEGPPSTPALADYLRRAGVALAPGWRAEVNLRAVEWVRDAVRRLTRGFLILIDYGHEARELYSPAHAGGTLTTFSRHTSSDSGEQRRSAGGRSGPPAWLRAPGEQDITSHVDFTSVREAAEAEGAVTLGFLDQTYFLMALMGSCDTSRPGQLKTLVMPGGLGSTMKVLLLGRNVGAPSLRGCSSRLRVT